MNGSPSMLSACFLSSSIAALQVGLASNSTFHTNIGEYAAVNLSASSLTLSKGEFMLYSVFNQYSLSDYYNYNTLLLPI